MTCNTGDAPAGLRERCEFKMIMDRCALNMTFVVALILLPGGGRNPAVGTVSAESGAPLEQKLQEMPLPEGWKIEAGVTKYDKENVFELIDGEAELYFPYGFQRVLAADYLSGGGRNPAGLRTDSPKIRIAVELYEMGSLLDAFGIYSNYRDPDTHFVELGAEGFEERTQAMFYQDRYFAKLKLSAKPEGNDGTLMAFAQAVAALLPANTVRPAELKLLGIPRVIPHSEQYIGQSLLGYAFFARGMMAQIPLSDKPAAPDTASEQARLFVVLGANPKPPAADASQAAAETVSKYVEYLDSAGAQHEWKETDFGKILLAHDPLHKGIAIQQVKGYVIGAARLADPAQGIELLRQLHQQAQDFPKENPVKN